MDSGSFVQFLLYQSKFGDNFRWMSRLYTNLMRGVGASKKVFEYIDRVPKINIDKGSYAPAELKGSIQFDGVSFAYPSRPDVESLTDISFSVNPGEVVALVGPSGGGKSSCVALLEHFYEPKTGVIKLDGVPIQEYDHNYLHTKIALVGQEPVLYAKTIQDNIAYAIEKGSWETKDVRDVAEMANAHSFISEMQNGYDTNTGEKGIQLSGGQKQRVAIARALMRKPTILLLDEATSALDAESEYMVQQALYKNLAGHTVIMIAHRLSTVEKADRIIAIEKGRVVQQGNHQELLAQEGLYKNLVHRQLLGGSKCDKGKDLHGSGEFKSKQANQWTDIINDVMQNLIITAPFATRRPMLLRSQTVEC